MQKTLLALSSILLLGTSSYAAHAADLSPQINTDFDTYVLALSWQPGFCLTKKNNPPHECQEPKIGEDTLAALTIHGLWPSLPASLEMSEGSWRSKGCSAVIDPSMDRPYPSVKKNWCGAKNVGMSDEFHQKLEEYMPGASDQTCLHKYEYAKHGVCFNFPPEDYFGAMIRLNNDIRHSAVGNFMKEHYGKLVNTDEFMQVIADTYDDAAISAVQLSCNSNKRGKNTRFLTEIRLTLRADAINYPLSNTSFVTTEANSNQSCGKSFMLNAY